MTGPQRDPRALVLDEWQDSIGQGLAGSPDIQAVSDDLLALIDRAQTGDIARVLTGRGHPVTPGADLALAVDNAIETERIQRDSALALLGEVLELFTTTHPGPQVVEFNRRYRDLREGTRP